MITLKLDLKREPKLVRVVNVYESVKSNIRFEDIASELETLHSSRRSPRLGLKAITLSTLQTAITADLQVRSRLVELRSMLSKNHAMISVAIESGANHVRSAYANELKQMYGTAAERNSAIENTFERFVKLKHSIETLIDDIDIKIKDIDQASHHLRNLVDIARMTLGRNGSGLEVA